MGTMIHHAMMLTTWSLERIQAAQLHALSIFQAGQVSAIATSPINSYYSFAIFTDGSKEGWTESADGDGNRAAMIEWLDGRRDEEGESTIQWTEIEYGEVFFDRNATRIARHGFKRQKKPAVLPTLGTGEKT